MNIQRHLFAAWRYIPQGLWRQRRRWIFMRGGAEYLWGVMNINEGCGLICIIMII